MPLMPLRLILTLSCILWLSCKAEVRIRWVFFFFRCFDVSWGLKQN